MYKAQESAASPAARTLHVPVLTRLSQRHDHPQHHHCVVALICARLVSADSFSLQKCFCVSADEVGYVATYNWTTTTESIVWDNYQSYPRNDDACPTMCGTECNNDRSECWTVPELHVMPGSPTKCGQTHPSTHACRLTKAESVATNMPWRSMEKDFLLVWDLTVQHSPACF